MTASHKRFSRRVMPRSPAFCLNVESLIANVVVGRSFNLDSNFKAALSTRIETRL
jgi:hypothetical protein